MQSLTIDVDSMRQYISAATGTRPDTHTDRVLNVFWHIRRGIPENGWHNVPGLRALLIELSDYNPFIPPVISQMEYMSRIQPRSDVLFSDAWAQQMSQPQEIVLNVNDFALSLNADPDILARQIKNHGKNADYFHAKFVEWHLSVLIADQTNSKVIIDLGTTHYGFSKMALKLLDPSVTVDMVDITYNAGRRSVSPRLSLVGANANDLSIYEDNSVDLVCLHNSLEHFVGDADSNAMQEVQRILRPGGTALITPLLTAPDYALSLQPIACFLAAGNEDVSEEIEAEVRQAKCLVRYNYNIISPFARNYDLKTFRSRILAKTPKLKPTLLTLKFDPSAFDANGEFHLGNDVPPIKEGALQRRSMLALKFVKKG